MVVEDEMPMRMALQDCLERQGYRVLTAMDGASGLEKAIDEKPNLVVLDVMMPKLDGFAVCAELRKHQCKVPILILTAKGKVEDRVTGLDMGADDFLIKPFSREELLARIRALLRRFERHHASLRVVGFGDVKVDFVAQQVWREGKQVELTAKEFSMLRLLIESAGQAISRDQFLDLVWGYNSFPTTRTVDKHVASLRSKIEKNPEEPNYIHTLLGVGYRFEGVLKHE